MSPSLADIRCAVLVTTRPGHAPTYRLAVSVPPPSGDEGTVRAKSDRLDILEHARLRAAAAKGFADWHRALPDGVRRWVEGLPLLVQTELHRAYEAL